MLTPANGGAMTIVAMPTNPLSDAGPISAISQSIEPEQLKRKKRETQKWAVQRPGHLLIILRLC